MVGHFGRLAGSLRIQSAMALIARAEGTKSPVCSHREDDMTSRPQRKGIPMKCSRISTVKMAITALMFSTCLPVYASSTDNRIEEAARESYVFKTYLVDEDVRVKSKDGAVTLNGTVAEEFQKLLAHETVAGLPGVNSVDNQLDIRGGSSPAYSDAWLTAKVKTTLLFHRSVRGTMITVKVDNGVVTLQGVADNRAQRELATEYARDIEGVKEVNNQMTIAAPSASASKTVGESIDDASITAQVKMSLLYHRSTSAINTKVETSKGVVTLYGKAKNAAEKDLVSKLVSDVNGVNGIVNRMTVE
jgi:hyperosmotically inducible periplasmic protein